LVFARCERVAACFFDVGRALFFTERPCFAGAFAVECFVAAFFFAGAGSGGGASFRTPADAPAPAPISRAPLLAVSRKIAPNTRQAAVREFAVRIAFGRYVANGG
jgi:hypothetical protein